MKKRNQHEIGSLTSRLGIRCSPLIQDPSEFITIFVSSVRSLFGELESHSAGVKVSRVPDTQDGEYHFILECNKQSTNAIRASLTMITTPSYLEPSIYRFDVFSIEKGNIDSSNSRV
mmetsp:Transcript_17572/g.38404  ORF Transcript_17572/g.38404 Transcript_17572/m.38404 type:complete len:117 (-) Transcript_17572:1066-1416(-)